MSLFKKLFYANVKLEHLSSTFGYDEETVTEMLDGTVEMTEEEKAVLEDLIGEKLESIDTK